MSSWKLIIALLALATVVPAWPGLAQRILPQPNGTSAPSPSGPPGSAPFPGFTIRACNKSDGDVWVALAVRKGEPTPEDWTIQGWWMIKQDQCNNMSRSLWGWFYFHALQQNALRVWPDPQKARDIDTKFCLDYNKHITRIYREGTTPCRRDQLKTFWAIEHQTGSDPVAVVTIE